MAKGTIVLGQLLALIPSESCVLSFVQIGLLLVGHLFRPPTGGRKRCGPRCSCCRFG